MKRHFNVIWLVLVVIVMGLLLLFPGWVSRESISDFLSQLGPMALAGYLVLSLFRALLLIPSTPFILAGAISFPQWPWIVLVISFLGIGIGGYLLHRFPSIGGYDRMLEGRYPEKIALLKRKMQSKHAFWFVAAWSFFPLVPTDAVCYVSGLAGMSYQRMISAVLLGESFIVVFYVFVGVELGEWLRI